MASLHNEQISRFCFIFSKMITIAQVEALLYSIQESSSSRLWGGPPQYHCFSLGASRDLWRRGLRCPRWTRSRCQLLSRVQLCDSQAPLSTGFSRQEHWSGLPFPSPGGRPDPGIEPRSSALQADCLPSEPLGKSNARNLLLGLPW